MGRQFLVGFSITLMLLVIGLRPDFRMPDQAGAGEEIVSLHGVTVFHQKIDRAAAANHSPLPALGAMVAVIATISVLGGMVSVLVAHIQRSSKPADDGGLERKSGAGYVE